MSLTSSCPAESIPSNDGVEYVSTRPVVIVTSVFFGLYLWLLDLGFATFVEWIFRRFGGQ